MSELSVAVVGTGPHPRTERETGFSMGYRHAKAYAQVDGCSIDACVDVVPEHAAAFAEEFGVAPDRAFETHDEMLDAVEPDLVSVCTPPKTHVDIVSDCAERVRAVHCEKPIAPTWGECKELVDRCDERDVQLTFNFQNRGRRSVRRVRELLDAGEIGALERVELSRADLMQTGIHNIDLANYFVGDAPVDWVFGQVDYRNENVWYTDMYSEDQGLGLWAYENGVNGLAFSGDHAEDVSDAQLQLVGTEGVIELRFWTDPEIRVRRHDAEGWTHPDVDDGDAQAAALRDVVEALREGRPSTLRAENALRATEIVFAIWESARRRGRVDLPLSNDGNALEELVTEE